MNKIIKLTSCLLSVLLLSNNLYADITGKWFTFDDVTGQKKGLVEIVNNNGVYEGFIRETFPGADTVCKGCKGKDQNKPVKNMKVISKLKKADNNKYDNGNIFDPKTGKTYKLSGELSQDEKTLKLRGFIGVSLIGRNQIWKRAE